MPHRDIIRVRKGKDHERRVSEEQHAVLPERPAGLMELADAELEAAGGGILFHTPCFYASFPRFLECPPQLPVLPVEPPLVS